MKTMLSTQKLMAFVCTTNPERALAFYRDKLGLAFVSQDAFALVFNSNGTTIRIATARELTPAKFTVLGWDVTDIGATVGELVEAGVALEHYGLPGQDDRGIWTAPGGAQVAWFKDPDGNVLSVSQH